MTMTTIKAVGPLATEKVGEAVGVGTEVRRGAETTMVPENGVMMTTGMIRAGPHHQVERVETEITKGIGGVMTTTRTRLGPSWHNC